jgi:hypothetical protein
MSGFMACASHVDYRLRFTKQMPVSIARRSWRRDEYVGVEANVFGRWMFSHDGHLGTLASPRDQNSVKTLTTSSGECACMG